MSFEEEFDKIIRQKSEEAEFPFNDKNWEQARIMIDSDRKASRLLRLNRLKKQMIAISIGVVAILTPVYFFYETMDSNKKIVAVKNGSISEIKSTTQTIEPGNSSIQNLNSETKAISKNNSQGLVDHSSANPSASSGESSSSKPSKVEPEMIAASNKQKSSNSVEQIHSEFNEEKTTQNNSVSHLPEMNSAIAAASEANAKSLNLNPVGMIANPTIEAASKEQSSTMDETSSIAVLESESSKIIATDYLVAKTLPLISDKIEKDLIPSETNTFKIFDTEYFKQKSKSHFLSIDLGTTYLAGWNSNDGMDAKGFNYYGTINYGVYLTNKLSVSLGLQAYNVSHINNPYYENSHKDYDFGSTTVYTVVTCTEMIYAAFPLKLNYKLNKANSFGIGLNAAYLLSSTNKAESYYYQDNAKIVTGSSSSKGVFEGVNQYNYMLTAQYNRRLGNRFGASAEFVYGLSDLFQNSSQSQANENTIGLRIGIHYLIFDN